MLTIELAAFFSFRRCDGRLYGTIVYRIEGGVRYVLEQKKKQAMQQEAEQVKAAVWECESENCRGWMRKDFFRYRIIRSVRYAVRE
ncbi:hypothetical protein GCM10020331_027770 [Ectobacillus funiculus]